MKIINKQLILLVCMIIIQSQIANAYDNKDAAINLSHEFVECAAFYSISSEALKHKEQLQQKNNSVLSDRYANAAKDFFSAALKFSGQVVTIARYEMSLKQMANDIHNDYSNISIIMNKYMTHCKSLYENPEARMNYWLEKN